MIPMYSRFEEIYIYGPLSKEEVDSVPFHNKWVRIDNDYFVGVNNEMPEWELKRIFKPEQIIQDTSDTEPVPQTDNTDTAETTTVATKTRK